MLRQQQQIAVADAAAGLSTAAQPKEPEHSIAAQHKEQRSSDSYYSSHSDGTASTEEGAVKNVDPRHDVYTEGNCYGAWLEHSIAAETLGDRLRREKAEWRQGLRPCVIQDSGSDTDETGSECPEFREQCKQKASARAHAAQVENGDAPTSASDKHNIKGDTPSAGRRRQKFQKLQLGTIIIWGVSRRYSICQIMKNNHSNVI